MNFGIHCPECGSDKVKTLTPVTGDRPAYLCENGHFFIDPAPILTSTGTLHNGL